MENIPLTKAHENKPQNMAWKMFRFNLAAACVLRPGKMFVKKVFPCHGSSL